MVTRSAAETPTWGSLLCFLQCLLSSDNHLDLPMAQPRRPGLPSLRRNVKKYPSYCDGRAGLYGWMAINPFSCRNYKVLEFPTGHQGAASVSEGPSQRDNLP